MHVNGPLRALIVEDDPDSARFTSAALVRRGEFTTVVVPDFGGALRALHETEIDLVVSDIELPGTSGLDLLPDLHRIAPGVPVIVLTAHAKLDYAIEALRAEADEFLVKPVAVPVLVERARTLALAGRHRRARLSTSTRVLAIGAHPDDIEIGVGATLAAHAAAGHQVTVLILSSGAVGGPVDLRRQEALDAASMIGARLVHLGFEDTRLTHEDGLIAAIESVLGEVDPDRVYTHSVYDRHQDHSAVHRATQVAARGVPNLACFQSPSGTVEFSPDRFVSVEDHLATKLRMLAAHRSQMHRDYMQEDVIRATARYWGRFGVSAFAEPLETIRASVVLDSLWGFGDDVLPQYASTKS